MKYPEAPSESSLSDYLTPYDPNKGDVTAFIQQLEYENIPLTLSEIIAAGASDKLPPEGAKIVKVGKFRTKREMRQTPQAKWEYVRFPIIMIEYEGGKIIWYHFPQVDWPNAP